jgi:hypothetical protein
MLKKLVFTQPEGEDFLKATIGKFSYLLTPRRNNEGGFLTSFHFNNWCVSILGTFQSKKKAFDACKSHYAELTEPLLAKPPKKSKIHLEDENGTKYEFTQNYQSMED